MFSNNKDELLIKIDKFNKKFEEINNKNSNYINPAFKDFDEDFKNKSDKNRKFIDDIFTILDTKK